MTDFTSYKDNRYAKHASMRLVVNGQVVMANQFPTVSVEDFQ